MGKVGQVNGAGSPAGTAWPRPTSGLPCPLPWHPSESHRGSRLRSQAHSQAVQGSGEKEQLKLQTISESPGIFFALSTEAILIQGEVTPYLHSSPNLGDIKNWILGNQHLKYPRTGALWPPLVPRGSSPPPCTLSWSPDPLSAGLIPWGSAGDTVFHLSCCNICAAIISRSTFLWQLAAVHSTARTSLNARNFKLSLGDFEREKTNPHHSHS